MKILAKNLPINELIAELDAYMVELGYTPSTMRHKRHAWNALKNLALKKGETHFSKDLGFELLENHYKIDPYAKNLKHHKANVRRAVMLLLEYQISGSIAGRTPESDHSFPQGFSALAEEYLIFLGDTLNLRQGTMRNKRNFLGKAFAFFVAHDVTTISDIDIEIVNCYLKTFLGYSKGYIHENISCLNSFFEFSQKNGYTENMIVIPKFPVYGAET